MIDPNQRKLTPRDEATEFLLYTAPDGQVKVECILHDETIWLTQKRIAELFGVGVPAISKHLENIYQDGELSKDATVSILDTVRFSYHSRLHPLLHGIVNVQSAIVLLMERIILNIDLLTS